MKYQRFGTEIQQVRLKNGLSISYIPKPGFSKTFAMVSVHFGAIDTSFSFDGVQYHTPAGVAHFLEHKMFEDADGNALQKFGKTGASPNAFTSYATTAYHFSCTEGFMDNLEILLRFVFTPYFTEQNVQKEQGIIAQEIRMMEDTPDWVTYVNVFAGMYHEHPIHTSIAGSVESIRGITPEILHQCYRAFYHPANMNLVICGTADFEQIVKMAEKLSPVCTAQIAERQYGTRRTSVASPEVLRHQDISRPTFLLGFKDMPVTSDENPLRRELIGNLAARILCGNTSPLFAEMYQEGLITRRFDSSYSIFPQAAVALCGGESRDPFAVRENLCRQVHVYATEGIDPARFARMKKACYGMQVRTLDQLDELCRAQAEADFWGINYLDFAEIHDQITGDDVQEMFVRWDREDCTTLSAVLPREWKAEK